MCSMLVTMPVMVTMTSNSNVGMGAARKASAGRTTRRLSSSGSTVQVQVQQQRLVSSSFASSRRRSSGFAVGGRRGSGPRRGAAFAVTPPASIEPKVGGQSGNGQDYGSFISSATPAYSVAKEGLVDDPTLANPLLRHEMLGCGWMGAVFDYEGVIVPAHTELHQQAWRSLAEAEGLKQPLAWMMARAEGMKDEQVVSELFCWARDPSEVRRLADAKEKIYRDSLKAAHRDSGAPSTAAANNAKHSGLVLLLKALRAAGVPCAVGCCDKRTVVEDGLREAELESYFDAVVTAEDVARGKPDPECYLYASLEIGRPPVRMVVFGSQNHSIEAAREAQMKCVAVASTSRPVYELASADMVVRDVGEITVANLKNLFSLEDGRDPDEPELEMELEEESEFDLPKTAFYDDD